GRNFVASDAARVKLPPQAFRERATTFLGPPAGKEVIRSGSISRVEHFSNGKAVRVMRLPKGWIIGLSIWSLCLTARFALAAEGSVAAGGGTYFVAPGIRTEFQFDSAHVQCK